MSFVEYRIPTLISGLVVLAIGLWVLVVRPGHRLHQALFLVLLCFATARIPLAWADSTSALGMRLLMYPTMAAIPAAAWFAHQFQRAHRPDAPARRWLAPTLVLLTAAAWLWFILDRGPFVSRPYHSLRFVYLHNLSLAAISLLAALTASRSSGVHRRSLKFIALGLSLMPAFEAFRFLPTALSGFYGPWSIADATIQLTTALAVALTGIVLWTKTRMRFAAEAIGVSMAAGVIVGKLASTGIEPLTLFTISSTWAIGGAIVLSYGLLHCRVFSIDLRLKSVMARSLVVGAVVLTFMVITEAVENMLPVGDGTSAVFAGVSVALLFQPADKAARAMAERAFPRVQRSDGYVEQRTLDMYAAALEEASLDGRLTEDEERRLINLQRELDLPIGAAVKTERRILDGLTISEYRAV